MPNELPFRVAILAVLLGQRFLWARYDRQNRHEDGVLAELHDRHTGLKWAAFGVSELCLYLYAVGPEWMAWSAFTCPLWLRWSGVIAGVAGTALQLWARHSLGQSYAGDWRVHRGQELVTDGPYRWARHPMYLAGMLRGLCFLLAPANWFTGVTWLGATLVTVAWRLPREEAALAETFGEAYMLYVGRARRFWPAPRPATPRNESFPPSIR